MEKELKKNIKILAEKFNHKIEYQKNTLILKSDINEIRLWETDKYGINISYNLSEDLKENLESETQFVYDILLELLTRNKREDKLSLKPGILLTIEEWIEEEGEFATEQLEKLKRDLANEQIEYRELGGNRFEAKYVNGILILRDDLYWAKSNVISI